MLFRSIIATLPDHPGVMPTYFDLLLPEWSGELAPKYPGFVERIEQAASGKSAADRQQILIQIADALRSARSVELEKKLLLKIHDEFGLRFRTYIPLERLANILPQNDPDSIKLRREIEQYGVRRDLLIKQAQAYTQFENLRKIGRAHV